MIRNTTAKSGWLVCAVLAVFVAGLAFLSKDRMPLLTAADRAAGADVAGEADLHDAVAAPGMVPGAAGWLQSATGIAALGRAARAPALLSRTKETLPPRATSGRAVFSGKRIIMDEVQPGVPEPGLKPRPEDQAQVLSSRLQAFAAAESLPE